MLADGIPDTSPLYYAGTLTENGTPVTGTREITVNLWSAQTGGTMLCQTLATGTTPALVTGGRFRIALASGCKAQINANNNVWVEVFDGTTSLGRTPIGAVPYAVEADHAVNATNATNATHASTADSATNATNATNAATAAGLAAGASGGLQQFEVAGSALQAPCAITISGTSTVDCTCPPGTFVVSGGGFTGGGPFLRESRPISTTTWRVTCGTPTNDQVLCAAYDLVCSKLGP